MKVYLSRMTLRKLYEINRIPSLHHPARHVLGNILRTDSLDAFQSVDRRARNVPLLALYVNTMNASGHKESCRCVVCRNSKWLKTLKKAPRKVKSELKELREAHGGMIVALASAIERAEKAESELRENNKAIKLAVFELDKFHRIVWGPDGDCGSARIVNNAMDALCEVPQAVTAAPPAAPDAQGEKDAEIATPITDRAEEADSHAFQILYPHMKYRGVKGARMRAIEKDLATVRAESAAKDAIIEGLKGALRFYANEWHPEQVSDEDVEAVPNDALYDDAGAKAINALAAVGEYDDAAFARAEEAEKTGGQQ